MVMTDPNLPLTAHRTVPLIIAATAGHAAQTVERLLEGGAIINYQRPDGVTPVYMASQNGHTSVVDVLLRHGTDPNLPLTALRSVPLEIAAANGHAQTVERLLEGGAIINYQRPDGVTPVYMASQNGHTSVVDVLLRHGTDPNLPLTAHRTVPLIIAATAGHAETVERLLEGGAIINYQRPVCNTTITIVYMIFFTTP
jgi:serine/threonine-protein phosphatase 6 regulatory ankyrin repeat subunit B